MQYRCEDEAAQDTTASVKKSSGTTMEVEVGQAAGASLVPTRVQRGLPELPEPAGDAESASATDAGPLP